MGGWVERVCVWGCVAGESKGCEVRVWYRGDSDNQIEHSSTKAPQVSHSYQEHRD